MSPDAPLADRVCAMLDDYLALGNRVENAVQARFVSWPDTPSIRDANHGQAVGARSPDEIDAVLERSDALLAGSGCRHRYFLCDQRTPPEFEARLVLEGYRLETELEFILEGPLRASPRKVELREVVDDEDWASVGRLSREDHIDAARRLGTPLYDESVTRGLVEARRRRAPPERTWLARVDGVDCAHFSSWPGSHGVGKVEDLFTLPEFRHRGIATALISHAVDDVRARGTHRVNIGADPSETPMHMYAAMGFRPIAVRRGYRLVPETGSAPTDG